MTTKQTTKKCAHCKMEIDKSASKCPHCGGKNYVWTLGRKLFAVLIILFMFGISNAINSPTEVEPVVQKTQAEIDAWNKSPAGKLCAKHPTWKERECELVADKKMWVGMSYEMIVYLRGKPDDSNLSNYGNGTRYQYCWDDYEPSCFYDNNDDGIIDAYN